MTTAAQPPSVDIAVIGHGAALPGVVDRLVSLAGTVSWAVVDGVSMAFAMGDRVDLLVGQDVVGARAVIVTTDATPQIPGEAALRGRGVSYCASCDGSLANGKRVVAVLDAPDLRRELDHLDGAEHLEVISTDSLVAVTGGDRLEGVMLSDGTALAASHLFLLTSRVPAPVLVPGIVVDESDRIILDEASTTSIPNIFAIGTGTTSRDGGSPADPVSGALTFLS